MKASDVHAMKRDPIEEEQNSFEGDDVSRPSVMPPRGLDGDTAKKRIQITLEEKGGAT